MLCCLSQLLLLWDVSSVCCPGRSSGTGSRQGKHFRRSVRVYNNVGASSLQETFSVKVCDASYCIHSAVVNDEDGQSAVWGSQSADRWPLSLFLGQLQKTSSDSSLCGSDFHCDHSEPQCDALAAASQKEKWFILSTRWTTYCNKLTDATTWKNTMGPLEGNSMKNIWTCDMNKHKDSIPTDDSLRDEMDFFVIFEVFIWNYVKICFYIFDSSRYRPLVLMTLYTLLCWHAVNRLCLHLCLVNNRTWTVPEFSL